MGTDIHSVFQRRTKSGWEDVPSKYEGNRHYALFAWLGDVRNGIGFAGVTTHTKIEPLSHYRGLPKDFTVSNGGYGNPADHNDKWMGDHSHGWLAASEILGVTPPRILRTGIVEVKWFRTWDGATAPESYCGGISGGGVLLSEPDNVSDQTTHVRIEWFDDCAESFAYFTDEVRRLQNEYGEVRFVFGFDS